MTKNQILYQQLQETKKHNQITRDETARSNRAQEALTAYRDRTSLDLRGQELRETTRHNTAYEQETERSNRAREAENLRHNQRTESLSAQQIAQQYWATAQNIALGYSQLSEQRRHNQRTEVLSSTNNDLRRAELISLDRYRGSQLEQQQQQLDYKGQELGIRQQEANIKQAQADETARANRAREAETHRANVADSRRGYILGITGDVFDFGREVTRGVFNTQGKLIDLEGRRKDD